MTNYRHLKIDSAWRFPFKILDFFNILWYNLKFIIATEYNIVRDIVKKYKNENFHIINAYYIFPPALPTDKLVGICTRS